MAYRILGTDFADFKTERDEILPACSGGVTQFSYATPKGDIRFQEHTLRDNLSILEGTYQMQDEVTISGKGDSGLLELQVNLSDADIHFQDKAEMAHVTPAQSANIAFLSADENEAKILFRKNVAYNTFDIHLPATMLDRYAGESNVLDQFLAKVHSNTSSMLFSRNILVSPVIHNAIQDIKTCTFEGLTRKIYLESKVYELIALLYEDNGSQRKEPAIRPEDRERIHEAASLIRENLEKPFTIIELARLVGINQTKLKTGFKMLFGKTTFGYLQDIRMHRAKRYLLDTQLSVQDIGMALGYPSASNFSIAFKRANGYSPMKLRENR